MTRLVEFECARNCQSPQLCDLATMAQNQKQNLYDNRIGVGADTARRFIDRTQDMITQECAAPQIAETAVEGYRSVAQDVFNDSTL